MTKIYVGTCPVCGATRELNQSSEGHWDMEQDPPAFVPEWTILSAVCPQHAQQDPGLRWKLPAGEPWVLVLDVREEAAP